MENRLIFKNQIPEDPQSTLGENKEKAPERVWGLKDGGKAEYLKLQRKINASFKKGEKPDMNDVFDLAREVFMFYEYTIREIGMMKAFKKGEFFIELYSLIYKKFDLGSIHGDKRFSDKLRKRAFRISCLVDPKATFGDYINANKDKELSDNSVVELVNNIMVVGNFHANYDRAKAIELVKYWLTQLYEEIDISGNDKSIVSWIEYQMEHYDISVDAGLEKIIPQDSLDAMEKFGLAYREIAVKIENKKALLETLKDIGVTEEHLKNAGNNIIIDVEKIVENSVKVSKVLTAGGLSAEGSADKENPLYFARPKIFLVLLWDFYEYLLTNDKISEELKLSVGLLHDQVLTAYGLNVNNENYSEENEELEEVDPSGELVDGAPDDGSFSDDVAYMLQGVGDKTEEMLPGYLIGGLPFIKYPNKKATEKYAELAQASKKIEGMGSAILSSTVKGKKVDEKKLEEMLFANLELRLKLKDLYGIEEVVALNPGLGKVVQKTIDYHEVFVQAIQNAAAFAVLEQEYEKLKKTPRSQWHQKIEDLRYVVLELKRMYHLPSNFDARYNNLLVQSRAKFQKWAILLQMPPDVMTAAPSPYLDNGEDNFYLEENEGYTYSPFVTSSSEPLGESYEIPEVMNLQLNRIEMIKILATSMMPLASSEVDTGTHYRPALVNQAVSAIQDKMKDYYFDEGYNGTPFDLDGAMKKYDELDSFIVGVTSMINGSDGLVKDFLPMVDFLMKVYDTDTAFRLAQDLRRPGRIPFRKDLLSLLSGQGTFTRDTIKKAGCAVAIILRKYLKQFVEARSMMTKLLEPHMPKSRAAVPDSVKTSLRNKARIESINQVGKVMKEGARAKFESDYSAAYYEANKKRPTDKEVETAYYDYFKRLQTMQHGLLYDMYLNHAALNFFQPYQGMDAADKIIHKQFSDSVGGRLASDSVKAGFFTLSDEGVQAFKKMGAIALMMLTEVAMVAASAGIGNIAAHIAVKGVQVGMRIAGAAAMRVAPLLVRTGMSAKKFSTIVKGAFNGLLKFGLHTTVEAGVFLEMHSHFSGQELLSTTWEKDKSAAMKRLGAEFILFGGFKASHFIGRYLKASKVGRQIMRSGVKNPSLNGASQEVMRLLNVKDPVAAAKNLENIVSIGGVRMAGPLGPFGKKLFGPRFVKLPDHVIQSLAAAQHSIMLSQSRLSIWVYKYIDKKAYPKLYETAVFLLENLQLDALAMLLGTAARHGIYPEGIDPSHLHASIAEIIGETYLMAAVFRGTFTVVGKGGKWMKTKVFERDLTRDVIEVNKGISSQQKKILTYSRGELATEISSLRTESATFSKEVSAKIAPLKKKISAIDRKLSSGKELTQGRRLGLKAERRMLETALATQKSAKSAGSKAHRAKLKDLESRFRTQKSKLEAELTVLKEQDAELQAQFNADTKYVDGVVPSYIARVLPGPIRRHIFKVYQVRVNGRKVFVDPSRLQRMLTIGFEGHGFAKAIELLNKSKRSILSVNQILFVSMKLPEGSRMAFLRAVGPKMTRGQKRLFINTVENMTIEAKDIPLEITADPKATNKLRSRKTKWRRALLYGLFTAQMLIGCTGAEPSRPANRPVNISVTKVDIAPKGNLYLQDKLRNADFTSRTLAIVNDAPTGAPRIMDVSKDISSKIFGKGETGQMEMFKAARDAGVPEKTVNFYESQFNDIPNGLRSYVRFVFNSNAAGEHNVYPLVDFDGPKRDLKDNEDDGTSYNILVALSEHLGLSEADLSPFMENLDAIQEDLGFFEETWKSILDSPSAFLKKWMEYQINWLLGDNFSAVPLNATLLAIAWALNKVGGKNSDKTMRGIQLAPIVWVGLPLIAPVVGVAWGIKKLSERNKSKSDEAESNGPRAEIQSKRGVTFEEDELSSLSEVLNEIEGAGVSLQKVAELKEAGLYTKLTTFETTLETLFTSLKFTSKLKGENLYKAILSLRYFGLQIERTVAEIAKWEVKIQERKVKIGAGEERIRKIDLQIPTIKGRGTKAAKEKLQTEKGKLQEEKGVLQVEIATFTEKVTQADTVMTRLVAGEKDVADKITKSFKGEGFTILGVRSDGNAKARQNTYDNKFEKVLIDFGFEKGEAEGFVKDVELSFSRTQKYAQLEILTSNLRNFETRYQSAKTLLKSPLPENASPEVKIQRARSEELVSIYEAWEGARERLSGDVGPLEATFSPKTTSGKRRLLFGLLLALVAAGGFTAYVKTKDDSNDQSDGEKKSQPSLTKPASIGSPDKPPATADSIRADGLVPPIAEFGDDDGTSHTLSPEDKRAILEMKAAKKERERGEPAVDPTIGTVVDTPYSEKAKKPKDKTADKNPFVDPLDDDYWEEEVD